MAGRRVPERTSGWGGGVGAFHLITPLTLAEETAGDQRACAIKSTTQAASIEYFSFVSFLQQNLSVAEAHVP